MLERRAGQDIPDAVDVEPRSLERGFHHQDGKQLAVVPGHHVAGPGVPQEHLGHRECGLVLRCASQLVTDAAPPVHVEQDDGHGVAEPLMAGYLPREPAREEPMVVEPRRLVLEDTLLEPGVCLLVAKTALATCARPRCCGNVVTEV